MNASAFRNALANAIGYWERGRIAYNLSLVIVTTAVFLQRLPHSARALSFDRLQGLFVLAVLANIAYCAAYPLDLIVQSSGYQHTWLRFRWALLFLGIVFAAVITQLIARGMFCAAG